MAAQIPWASHKDCKFAIGLQSARGVAATTFYAIPTSPEEQEIDLNPDYSFFQFGGGFRGKTHYETKGSKIEGKIMIPLCPGYTGTGDLYDWIWGRGATPYFQGNYATIIKAVGAPTASNYKVEQYLDCKVSGGNIPVDYGMDFARVICNVMGMSLPTSVSFPSTDDSLFTTAPYRYSEAAFRLDTGAGLAAEVYTRNHNLEFDNMIESQDLLNGTTLPSDLPNTEWADWKGSFDRPFVDTALRVAFLAGTECQYELTLARGGTSAVFAMERILYLASPLNPGTSGVVKQSGNSFQALCPLDDNTVEPCVISETVGS